MNDSMTKDRVRVPTPQNGNGDVVDDDDDDDHHHHPNRPPQHHQNHPHHQEQHCPIPPEPFCLQNQFFLARCHNLSNQVK